jgi:SAM-dependent methyltransferase
LNWLALPPKLAWIDVGCGTGALSETIIQNARPRSLLGIDQSEAYAGFARRRLGADGVEFMTGSAEKIDAEEARFDAAVSGLVLNFVPRPALAASEMLRVTKPGGTVAAYVWDYAGKMELIRYFWDAAIELDPSAAAADEGKRFPLCLPGALRDLFQSAGLKSCKERAVDVETRFTDFDDFWNPFLGGQGPAPGYAMSLSEERRNALRDILHKSLAVAKDGSISLTARAWAVKGVR